MTLRELMVKCNELTPIEEINGVLYKRDDYFKPFSDIPINGGKLRQCIQLMFDNYEHIKNECNGTVATAAGIPSPQGLIVTKSAKTFGFKTVLGYGNHNDEKYLIDKYKMVRLAYKMGADIRVLSKLGYDSVLVSKLKELQVQEKFYIVKFGINLNGNPNAIVNSIAKQVQNLPDELDNLVVPVGSAITCSGILKGIEQYGKKIKNIYFVQISGYDRSDTVLSIVPETIINYKFIIDKTYPYSTKVDARPLCGFSMDSIYEAKALVWMMRNVDYKKEKTLYWIVGNGDLVRE